MANKIQTVTVAAFTAVLTWLRSKIYTKTETDAKITEEIGKIKPYELPVADAKTLGGVKAGGTGISISADGVISATGDASPNSVEWGVIKNVPDAAATVKGVITEGRVSELAQAKVDALKLKTINGQDIKGEGDITIDLSLYKVVTTLPTADIDENKIYLVADASGKGQNVYKEHLYVNGKWEVVGEYKAEVDLTPLTERLDNLEAFKDSLDFMDETAGTALATEIFGA